MYAFTHDQRQRRCWHLGRYGRRRRNGDGVSSLFTLNGAISTQMTFDLAPNLIEANPEVILA